MPKNQIKSVSIEEVKQALKVIVGSPVVKMGVLSNQQLSQKIQVVESFIGSVSETIESSEKTTEELKVLKKKVNDLFELAPAFSSEAVLPDKVWDKIDKLKSELIESCKGAK
jgi:hypothetical protein